MRVARALLAAAVLCCIAYASGTFAFGQQAPPMPKPFQHFSPLPLPVHTGLPVPGHTPLPLPKITLAPALQSASVRDNVALQSMLGPKAPLALLAPLPPATRRNTVRPSQAIPLGLRRLIKGKRHRLDAQGNSFQFSTVSGCSSTTGSIFNLGCEIQFNFVFCNANYQYATYCYGGYQPITLTDTYQDYYIDANSNTAQTIGSTYTFGNGSTSDTGPTHDLTLNNPGTVVLATYDKTSGKWIAVVYLTVTSSGNAIEAFSDASRVVPSTNYIVPSSGTTPVYLTITSAQYSDVYVVYVESTSINPACIIVIPGGAGRAGPCNAMEVTGTEALSSGNLYMEWDVPSGSSPGTYSLVAYDQTLGKRIAQTQISLVGTGGTVSLTPTGGNSSPNPKPAGTPSTRFAFDSTTDASDSYATVNISGLAGGNYDCLAVSDPNGRVHQTYPGGPFDYYCGNSSNFNLTEQFANYQSPYNYAPNTYTISIYDRNSGSIVASSAFQILGYNAVTEFTNSAGTSVTGTSLVLPKGGGSVGAGIEFVNDGDGYYGTGNGDSLHGFYYESGKNAVTISLPCAPCTSETVTDSNGNSWTVTLTNYGSGSKAGSSLTAIPVSSSTTLANNGYLIIPNLSFAVGSGGSTCTGGCAAESSILPVDGLTWSKLGNSGSGNLTYFTNGGGNTYSGTATFIHLGITPTGTPYSGSGAGVGEEPHGFYPRMSQSLYAVNEPFAEPSNKSDVYELVVSNTGTTTITGLAIKLPSGYAPGTYSLTYGVDGNSPTAWTQDTTCTVTGAYCIKPNGSNSGIASLGSETIYLDVSPLPPSSFTYSEVQVSVYKPASYALTADPTYPNTVLVSSLAPSQESIDALAVGAYSLDGSLMTPLFNPTSEGEGTDNAVQFSVKNTSLAQDQNPDYLDAIVFEMPKNKVDLTKDGSYPLGFFNLTSGWKYYGYVDPGLGAGTVDYWFGPNDCSGTDFQTSGTPGVGNSPQTDGPTTGTVPDSALPSCGATLEQDAIAPGSSFNATAYVNVGATAGTITGTMYAHGANGNGWSTGHTFTLTVAPISATAGFVDAGGYPTAASVPTNTAPQIGTDANSTYGNAFVYEIDNTSSSGNNLTTATITIPYEDSTSGVPGQDSNNHIWTITSTPTLSGSGWSNCSVTSYSSATPGSGGSNGSIVIGGSSCTITSGAKLDVSFDMTAPYKPNDSYHFSTQVGNGGTNVGASENWTGDTYISTVLQASLTVYAWPSTGPLGALAPTCSAACTYNQASNLVDFGALASGQSNTGTDVVLLDVATNAASPTDWSIYVTTCSTCNPANTGGTYANEMNTQVDQAKSTSGFSTYMTTMSAVPTSGTGLKLVDSGGTMGSSRTPFGIVNNFEIYINGGTTSGQTSTVTYTFVAN